MKTFVVFGELGEVLVTARTYVRAVQKAMGEFGGVNTDWRVHDLLDYSEKCQQALRAKCEHLEDLT